jgi:hypothetical protein
MKNMTLKETHDWIDMAITDWDFKYKASRNPQKKRQNLSTLTLFKSIKEHLKPL